MDSTYTEKVDSLGLNDRLTMGWEMVRENEGTRTTRWFLV